MEAATSEVATPPLWGSVPPPPQWFAAAPLLSQFYAASVHCSSAAPAAIASPSLSPPAAALSPPASAPSRARKKPALRLRNFLCMHPGCGKSFADNAHLRDHTVVHTGERRLRCRECGRRFARLSTLRDHQRVHSGERPFSCAHADCDKRYSSRAALRFHVASHVTRSNAETPATERANGDEGAGGNDTTTTVTTLALHATIEAQQSQIEALQAELARLKRKATLTTKKGGTSRLPRPSASARTSGNGNPPMVAPVAFLLDGGKPFECHVCRHRFTNFFQLSFHAKQHAGVALADVVERQEPMPVGPKFCPEAGCEYAEAAGSGKALKNLQTLKRHWQRRHQTDRPFVCTRCVTSSVTSTGASGLLLSQPKTFKTRENLKAHEKDCRGGGGGGGGDSQRMLRPGGS